MLNKLLTDILQYKRPNRSKSEKRMIARFIDSVPEMKQDTYGNRIIRIGETSTMISCHTDTVHDLAGTQELNYNSRSSILSVAKSRGRKAKPTKGMFKVRECLGADDGAGVYLALRMIEAKRPGLYVFHRGEERGGLGSSYIATNNLHLLDGIERCIALDRRGQNDIITHQMMGRCCSDEFAESFGDLLEMQHFPCAFGTFTDSANYTDYVAECTNLSVGYWLEHTDRETLNVDYLEELLDRLCSIDLDTLPTVRLPGDNDYWDDPKPKAKKRASSFLADTDSSEFIERDRFHNSWNGWPEEDLEELIDPNTGRPLWILKGNN